MIPRLRCHLSTRLSISKGRGKGTETAGTDTDMYQKSEEDWTMTSYFMAPATLQFVAESGKVLANSVILPSAA